VERPILARRDKQAEPMEFRWMMEPAEIMEGIAGTLDMGLDGIADPARPWMGTGTAGRSMASIR
jgi:hypothetical protein